MRILSALFFVLIMFFLYADDSLAQATESLVPEIAISVGGKSGSATDSLSSGIKVMLFLTSLAFLPTLLLTATCFTRIAVVLSMTRTAMGVQQAPPNMILTGLALFLTMSIMNPVFLDMYNDGIKPYLDGSMAEEEALTKGLSPLKKFLIANTREKDIALFLQVSNSKQPKVPEDLPFLVALPSFVVSELNVAFQIGFLIALPFLILDMVVASVLTSMSMITLPPVVISLPLKLMMFVVVDGWSLIISSLVKTYVVDT
jgi:flagellar biosynthesis protein FliP